MSNISVNDQRAQMEEIKKKNAIKVTKLSTNPDHRNE